MPYCKVCTAEIADDVPQYRLDRRKYCSKKCAMAAAKRLRLENNPHARTPMAPATRGAISEMKTVIDLAEMGCDVFRAVSPSCSCDLIALRDGICLRIEVKTGYVMNTGARWYQKAREGRADHVAAVYHDGVRYEPPLPWMLDASGSNGSLEAIAVTDPSVDSPPE